MARALPSLGRGVGVGGGGSARHGGRGWDARQIFATYREGGGASPSFPPSSLRSNVLGVLGGEGPHPLSHNMYEAHYISPSTHTHAHAQARARARKDFNAFVFSPLNLSNPLIF